MSKDDDENEIVCESYRNRVRLMDWLITPVHVLELLVLVGGVIGAIMLVLKH